MSPKPRRTHPPTNPEIYWLEVSRAEAEEMATQGTVPFAVRIDLQELIGKMTVEMETARLWLRRQIDLETCEPPTAGKTEVVQHWRMAKGVISESAFLVAQLAMKMCGTSGTTNRGVIARMLRDTAMALVMAFPAERGRLEAAKTITDGQETTSFMVKQD